MLPTSIQVQRRTPSLPCAMALRLIRFRPGDRLYCHHRRCKLSPASDLTPAPGRRTQTISPYARTRRRQKAMPGAAALVSRDLTSTAPCPSFATMAYAPLVGQDGGSFNSDLPDGATGIFSLPPIDPYLAVICPSGNAGLAGRVAVRGGEVPPIATDRTARSRFRSWNLRRANPCAAVKGNVWSCAGF